MKGLPLEVTENQKAEIPHQIYMDIKMYVEDRVAPGHFLTCVLSNDLFGAVGHADEFNLKNLQKTVRFIFSLVPCICYGTKDIVKDWVSGKWQPGTKKKYKGEVYIVLRDPDEYGLVPIQHEVKKHQISVHKNQLMEVK